MTLRYFIITNNLFFFF